VEEVSRAPAGPFEDLEMIRVQAGMQTSRFTALIGVPERSWRRWQSRARAGDPPKGPWPAPVVEVIEPVAAKYATDWPAWGHRKVHALMTADGHQASARVKRAMAAHGSGEDDYCDRGDAAQGREPLKQMRCSVAIAPTPGMWPS
jgi:hypothetical protein